MIVKSNFIGETIGNINEKYDFISELGHGSYGQVYRIQNLLTGKIFACKKMNKRKIKHKERFQTEINLLKATDHPNIIKLYDIFEDSIFIYLIMEECTGGEFFERLARRAKHKKMYTEKDAAKIFKQILLAVNYLHCHGVCHRDLKPENILFRTVEEDSPLKLIDFGLSKIFDNTSNIMKGQVGTSFYMAPEVLTGQYNEKCDVWSCGVILYIMLCGKPPFYETDPEKLKKLIISMNYNFNYKEFEHISEDAKNLIRKMFLKADKRPSVYDLLNDKWIIENAPNSKNYSLNVDWVHASKYCHLNLLQKSIINFTAFHLTDDETKKFVEMFNSLDENGDGVLSMEEIKKGFEKNKFEKINNIDVVDLFNEMDVDKNGLINYTEFISALMDYKKYIKKDNLIECFKNYDADKSGKISFQEFSEIIKSQNDNDKKDIYDLFKKLDENNDGEIDFEEFVNGFNNLD